MFEDSDDEFYRRPFEKSPETKLVDRIVAANSAIDALECTRGKFFLLNSISTRELFRKLTDISITEIADHGVFRDLIDYLADDGSFNRWIKDLGGDYCYAWIYSTWLHAVKRITCIFENSTRCCCR